MIMKPWQVTIDLHDDVLWLRVREHSHGSVAFSREAAAFCNGATEQDDDGYTIRCRDEPSIVEAAREIAAMSEAEEANDHVNRPG